MTRRAATTHYFAIGEIDVELRCQSAPVARDFLRLYEPYRRTQPEASAVRVEVRDERRFRWQRGPYALYGRSGKGVRLDRRYEVLPHLEWLINWEVIQQRSDFLQLHAASLQRDGRGLVLPANTGCGKTTLAAALLARGWSYFSDEFALLDPQTLALRPFPRALCIKEPGFAVIDRLALRMERKTPYQKVTKGRVAYLNPLDIRPGMVAQPAPVRWIVFPRYAAGAAPLLSPMSPAEAAYEATRQCFNFPVYRGRAVALLARLAQAAECYRLIAGDVDETCDLLERYLLTERMRRAG